MFKMFIANFVHHLPELMSRFCCHNTIGVPFQVLIVVVNQTIFKSVISTLYISAICFNIYFMFIYLLQSFGISHFIYCCRDVC